jgi:hypothetical protein
VSDPLDDLNKFLADKEDVKGAKILNFELSTLALVLRQLGHTTKAVHGFRAQYGDMFNWDWFNGENFCGARVGSTREFSYNFFDLLLCPHKCPVTDEFRAFKGDSSDPCCLIFAVYGYGRWVATNLATAEDPSLHVALKDFRFNVLPFPKFFQNRWAPDA